MRNLQCTGLPLKAFYISKIIEIIPAVQREFRTGQGDDTHAVCLKRAQISAGYKTAKEFAEKNGIPPADICSTRRWGKRGISVSVAEQYAAILGVTAQEILFGQPQSRDDCDNILLQNFHGMTPKEQEALLLVTASMAAWNKRVSDANNANQEKQQKAAS